MVQGRWDGALGCSWDCHSVVVLTAVVLQCPRPIVLLAVPTLVLPLRIITSEALMSVHAVYSVCYGCLFTAESTMRIAQREPRLLQPL